MWRVIRKQWKKENEFKNSWLLFVHSFSRKITLTTLKSCVVEFVEKTNSFWFHLDFLNFVKVIRILEHGMELIYFSNFMVLTKVSQQVPDAHVALSCIKQLAASQHGLSQCSGRPQSPKHKSKISKIKFLKGYNLLRNFLHSSPGSVNPFPHVGPS